MSMKAKSYSGRLEELAALFKSVNIDSSKLSVAPVKSFATWLDISKFVNSTEVKVEPDIVIDGRVFRIDDDMTYDEQGRTAKFRKGSIAYKFPAEREQIVIRSIEWSMGSRDITPVAIFDPVVCSGASISRANLHSVKNMVDLGATVGAILALTRQGEVIPKLSKVEEDEPTEKEDRSFVTKEEVLGSVPRKCEACGNYLSLSPTMTHLFCSNEGCGAKRGRRIEIFAKAVGVEYIGQGIADELAKIFNDPMDILVAGDDIWKMAEELVGVGIVKRIRQSIKAVRDRGVLSEDFIAGLNLERLGLSTIKLILENFSLEEALIGDVNLKSIHGFAEDSETILKESLRKAHLGIQRAMFLGIRFSMDKKAKVEPKVYFCITGSLSKSKEDFARDMGTRGWIRSKEVTAACKYLVTNDATRRSAKWLKAERLEVRIIDEQTAIKMSNE